VTVLQTAVLQVAVFQVVAFTAAGACAGGVARVLLCRLRRGARVRPPWCELAVGALWAVSAAQWAFGPLPARWLPVLLGLGWLAVAAAAVDLRHRRLPDALTLPALPAVLLLLSPLGAQAVLRGMLGAVVLAGAHAAIHLAAPRAMGAGDVKLAGPLGAVLAASSWPAVPLGAVVAALLTAMVATFGVTVGLLARGDALPHGPSMLAAGWLVVAGAATG
jgi:leader peptidase (prepilin peptidase)/N-methyltransferase